MILRWLAAILALGCRSLRISGNTVDQARLTRDGGGIGIGIASDLTFGQVDVTENVVRRLSDETQSGEDPSTLGQSIALAIGDPSIRDMPMLVKTETSYLIVFSHEIFEFKIPIPRPLTTSVRGNTLDGAGASGAAVIGPVGPLTFAENFCNLDGEGVDIGSSTPAVVVASAETLVLPDNQIRSTFGEGGLAVDATVDELSEEPLVTATGNITDGEIRVNSQPLKSPWQPLNIRLS
jgi:hypothetical protein